MLPLKTFMVKIMNRMKNNLQGEENSFMKQYMTKLNN